MLPNAISTVSSKLTCLPNAISTVSSKLTCLHLTQNWGRKSKRMEWVHLGNHPTVQKLLKTSSSYGYTPQGSTYIYYQISTHSSPNHFPLYFHAVIGYHLAERVNPKCSHSPHSCKEGTRHWSSTTYPHNLCGKNANMTTLSARHCLHIFPSRCNKPAQIY
jgi:hypothetical protein